MSEPELTPETPPELTPETAPGPLSGPVPAAGAEASDPPPSDRDFIRLEKNLTALGFFTPASKATKKPVAKTVQFTRLLNGRPRLAREPPEETQKT